MLQYTSMLDSKKIKQDFPIFTRKVHGKDLVYLDNSATSQKPKEVIDSMSMYYSEHVANVHRGVHTLSDESTDLFESGKQLIADFFGAQKQELIFVQNTTEAINGVAYGWVHNIMDDDVIIATTLDHHSNIVVWQELAKRTGCQVIFVGITAEGMLNLEDLQEKIHRFADKLKLVALPHVSNALGSVVPIPEVVSMVHQANPATRVLVDGAQAAPHMKIDFHKLGVDFYVFSGHKMLGPMGIGGLLVRDELLKTGEMQPWLFGGGMISEVHESHTEFHDNVSERFVAGTPDVASVVGLAAACEYLTNLGMQNVFQHDKELVEYALQELSKLEHIEIVGPGAEHRVGSVSFLFEGVHAHDVAQVLDSEGIAVRSGHHCTMPLHTSQNWVATTRASFQVYNSKADIDMLVSALKKVTEVLL